MRTTGTYKTIGGVTYFVPHPLPPAEPPLALDNTMVALYGKAAASLAQLNEASASLPDARRFLRSYVMKEALLSSDIEGIHTTLIEVFTHQLGDVKSTKETQLVINYSTALEAVMGLMRGEQMPLSNRLLIKAHELLMADGDGDKAMPGQFRKQAVRVGKLVPPPPLELQRLMGDLENYIHSASELPPLLTAGLVHVQFETIHPFLDGNGRIGRLLIVLMLIESGLLREPIIYPSYYFKKHKGMYYDKLDSVRTAGDFEGWLQFYLHAIYESAQDAYIRIGEIQALAEKLRQVISTDAAFAKIREGSLQALDYLFVQPVVDITGVSERLGKAYNTAHNIINKLCEQGILTEQSEHKRNKRYYFDEYLALLDKEYAQR